MEKIMRIVTHGLFSLFCLFISIGYANAWDLNFIYFGNDIVELEINAEFGPNKKLELYRGFDLIETWTDYPAEYNRCYYQDKLAEDDEVLPYQAKAYTRSTDDAEWELTKTSNEVAPEMYYVYGTIHNSDEWRSKFDKFGPSDLITWKNATCNVKGVTVADGHLVIEDAKVYFAEGPLTTNSLGGGDIWAFNSTFTKSDALSANELIRVYGSTNSHIEGCTITGDMRMYFENCSDAEITENVFNIVQIRFDNSNNINFSNNTGDFDFVCSGNSNHIWGNTCSKINVGGMENTVENNHCNEIRTGSSNDLIRENQCSTMSIGGTGNEVLKNTVSYIELGGNNNLVKDNFVKQSQGDAGIYICAAIDNTVEGNRIEECLSGIEIDSAEGNMIRKNNIIRNEKYGILLFRFCKNNQILNNAINENGRDASDGAAICLAGEYCDTKEINTGNVIAFNHIWGNRGGISTLLQGNDSNGIHDNIFENNTHFGIKICGGQDFCTFGNSPNIVYNNIFKNNKVNAFDDNSDNTWQHAKYAINHNIVGGPYLAGNYWDDYTGVDGNGDGIGDTPYAIPGKGGASDYLPLIASSQYPAMTVAPDPHNFGQVEVGAVSEPQTFTVTNTGSGTIDVALFYISGAPGEFFIANNDCSGCTLASGATCSLDVVFSPESEGAKTASLKLSSNASLNIPLSGNAVSPTIGDLNSDYEVTLADAIIALRAVARMAVENIRLDGDVNGDGQIGMAEAIYALKKVAGLRD